MFSLGYSNSFNQKEHYILPFKNDFNEIAKSAAVRNSNISFTITQFTFEKTIDDITLKSISLKKKTSWTTNEISKQTVKETNKSRKQSLTFHKVSKRKSNAIKQSNKKRYTNAITTKNYNLFISCLHYYYYK